MAENEIKGKKELVIFFFNKLLLGLLFLHPEYIRTLETMNWKDLLDTELDFKMELENR